MQPPWWQHWTPSPSFDLHYGATYGPSAQPARAPAMQPATNPAVSYSLAPALSPADAHTSSPSIAHASNSPATRVPSAAAGRVTSAPHLPTPAAPSASPSSSSRPSTLRPVVPTLRPTPRPASLSQGSLQAGGTDGASSVFVPSVAGAFSTLTILLFACLLWLLCRRRTRWRHRAPSVVQGIPVGELEDPWADCDYAVPLAEVSPRRPSDAAPVPVARSVSLERPVAIEVAPRTVSVA